MHKSWEVNWMAIFTHIFCRSVQYCGPQSDSLLGSTFDNIKHLFNCFLQCIYSTYVVKCGMLVCNIQNSTINWKLNYFILFFFYIYIYILLSQLLIKLWKSCEDSLNLPLIQHCTVCTYWLEVCQLIKIEYSSSSITCEKQKEKNNSALCKLSFTELAFMLSSIFIISSSYFVYL